MMRVYISSSRIVCAASNSKDAHQTLNIPRNASKIQIKEAYYKLIRQLHPDVNPDVDTTKAAAELNAAYQSLIEGFSSDDDGAEEDALQVFDKPEAIPDQLFVNPFACYNIPIEQYQVIQEVARSNADDPVAALKQAGLLFNEDTAIIYLSPRQLEILEDEINRALLAAGIVSVEACEFFVYDCLTRARRANNRMY